MATLHLRDNDANHTDAPAIAPGASAARALAQTDGVLIVVLTSMLVVAMWSFFDLFVASVIAAGLVFSIALRRWRDTHMAALPAPGTRAKNPELNVATIQIAGDIGGLMFVAGCLAIFFVGMPALRGFVLASAVVASVMAAAVIAWRKTHTMWSNPGTSIKS